MAEHCGCRIGVYPERIVHCPMHKAASAMLAALEAIRDHANVLDAGDPQAPSARGRAPTYILRSIDAQLAIAAIAAARKETP